MDGAREYSTFGNQMQQQPRQSYTVTSAAGGYQGQGSRQGTAVATPNPNPYAGGITSWVNTGHVFRKNAQGHVQPDTPCLICGKVYYDLMTCNGTPNAAAARQ